MQALAIIRVRARKRSRFLLELNDNETRVVLTLSATVLAIIASCSPTEGCAHIGCQWEFGGRKPASCSK